MEGVPEELESPVIAKELHTIEGVANVHHIHVWGLTGDKLLASLHLRLTDGASAGPVKAAVRARLKESFSIDHVTIEVDDAGEHPDEVAPVSLAG